jgi:hypothetical protein
VRARGARRNLRFVGHRHHSNTISHGIKSQAGFFTGPASPTSR